MANKNKSRTPLSAIKNYCIYWCVTRRNIVVPRPRNSILPVTIDKIKYCSSKECPLYRFRFGKDHE